MKSLIMLVGPPGSGKSTRARAIQAMDPGITYVNQDTQGKDGHMWRFEEAVAKGLPIILDRMNFNKEQRHKYLEPAKKAGYQTEIRVIHESYATCMERMDRRKDHETIKDLETAIKAILFFFKNYERVEDWEADVVTRHWPEGNKPQAIYVDLDGTLCNCEHRRHHVRTEGKKKNWMAFMDGIKDDLVVEPVMDVLHKFDDSHHIVYCSGRGGEVRKASEEWLLKHGAPHGPLYMRLPGDSRQDNIVKEILLDFEILTRFSIFFCLDDRDQVVKMLRSRGLTVFQVAEGNF